jgi:hypothetical protein
MGSATSTSVVSFRLQPIMRRGTASSIAETGRHYRTLRDAEEGGRRAYNDDRVLYVMVVEDPSGRFVEWLGR